MKTPKPTGDATVDAAMRDSFRDLPRWIDCGQVDVVTAGAPISVPHRLGSVPEFFVAMKTTDMEVFATEDLQRQWTSTSVVVVPTVATPFRLYVGKL